MVHMLASLSLKIAEASKGAIDRGTFDLGAFDFGDKPCLWLYRHKRSI